MRGMGRPEVSEQLYFSGSQMELARAAVAAALGADADEIMLNEAAGVGINVVANGIDWAPGDAVIITDHEHPSNLVPWWALAQRRGIEVERVADELPGSADDPRPNPDAAILAGLERVLASRGPRARLLSFSHVSRRTGARLPAREMTALAHKHGCRVLIDGAQAFGAIPVDVKALGCDYYTVNGHKYCMGPTGTGAVYIAHDKLDTVLPSWVGCHGEVPGTEEALDGFELLPSARRFEFGSRNISDHAGWRAALEVWHGVGWPRVFDAIAELTGYVKARLQTIEGLTVSTPAAYEASSTIVAFAIEGLAGEEIVRRCQERGVLIAASEGRAARLSAHVYNTAAEVDRLVGVLAELQAEAVAEVEAQSARL